MEAFKKEAWTKNPAPMVIFTYCRLDSTKRLIESLEKTNILTRWTAIFLRISQ